MTAEPRPRGPWLNPVWSTGQQMSSVLGVQTKTPLRLSGPTVPDADVDSAGSFLDYLYIVSQYTVRLRTLCVWRILCLRNSSSVPYFRQPLNLPTAARRNRKCTECGTTAFGRNRMSAESAHLSTFGAETETEADIRSTSNLHFTANIVTETDRSTLRRTKSLDV